jgi:hypothetical protein
MTDDLVTRLREPVIDPFFGYLIEPIKKDAANRIEKLEGIIQELMEYVDEYSDVVDGDDGVPEPNRAMSLLVIARAALEGEKK